VYPYVLKDFSKDETKAVDKLIDAVAGELPKLIAGDEGAFMSRVAHLMAPPKPPKPKPPPREEDPAATAGTVRDGSPSASAEDTDTPE
jgi:PTH1 family peptidyl-tRNA hydrolase